MLLAINLRGDRRKRENRQGHTPVSIRERIQELKVSPEPEKLLLERGITAEVLKQQARKIWAKDIHDGHFSEKEVENTGFSISMLMNNLNLNPGQIRALGFTVEDFFNQHRVHRMNVQKKHVQRVLEAGFTPEEIISHCHPRTWKKFGFNGAQARRAGYRDMLEGIDVRTGGGASIWMYKEYGFDGADFWQLDITRRDLGRATIETAKENRFTAFDLLMLGFKEKELTAENVFAPNEVTVGKRKMQNYLRTSDAKEKLAKK